MEQTRILLVDDCKQWRETLHSIIEAIPRYQVVAEAGDALEAVEKAAQLHPDIVLLDVGMPILNGIEAAPRIRRASPNSTIVFVTQNNDREVRAAALATGAQGYLLKSKVVPELIPALDAILMVRVPEALESSVADGHEARALASD